MYRRQTYNLALLGLLAAVLPAGALGQAAVELKAQSRVVYAGEAFVLYVEISGSQEVEDPQISEVPDCTITRLPGTSESSFTSIVNGSVTMSRTVTYQYEIVPQVVGELLIPPISVVVDGKVLKTQPARFIVRPSDAEELFAVEITAGRKRIYVGQRVRLTMTIWVKPIPYGNQLLPPREVLQLITPIDFGPFPLQYENPGRFGRMRTVNGERKHYYAYDFVADFVAERPGRLSFENIQVGIDYPTRGGRRNLRARPKVEPIDVLPVPAEGRPPAYAGAVGLFDIRAVAKPRQVRVGDPIELTIEITGDGPLETLPPPLLSANSKLSEGFRLPSEQLAGEYVDGRRRFTFMIRAERDDLTEIPSIEYPYFDPDAERFVIARTEPIPLEVSPAARISAPEITPARQAEPSSAPAALQALDGLHDIETSETVLLADTAPVRPAVIATVMAAPLAVFVLSWAALAIVRAQLADPARRRRQAALRNARRRVQNTRKLPPREIGSQVADALAGYLADRVDAPPARLAGSAGSEFLRSRGVADNLVERWAALLQHCDEATFAGDSKSDGEALCSEALKCLSDLERQKL